MQAQWVTRLGLHLAPEGRSWQRREDTAKQQLCSQLEVLGWPRGCGELTAPRVYPSLTVTVG